MDGAVHKYKIFTIASLGMVALILWTSKRNNSHKKRRIKKKTGSLFSYKSNSNNVQRVIYPGLSNMGNNCFFNAILQSLASLEIFASFLKYRLQMDIILKRQKIKFSCLDSIDALDSIIQGEIASIFLITSSYFSNYINLLLFRFEYSSGIRSKCGL